MPVADGGLILMSLTSVAFMIFVAVLVSVYYIVPIKFRWFWLLVVSLFFYMSYDLKLSIWLFGSVICIYMGGLILQSSNNKYEKILNNSDISERKKIKKQAKAEKGRIATVFVILLALVWIGFKFGANIINLCKDILGMGGHISSLVAPLGLSFFILSAISYVVDIKRGKIQAQRNPLKLLLWLGYFPQIIQGPIVRYKDTSEQLYIGNHFEEKNIIFGAQLMLWGYFKKLMIANYANVVVSTIFASKHIGFEYVVGIVLYAAQIYCDFSGGIDIISGISQMLGIHLPMNFKRPYFSKSIEEYWRRWHVTLGAWFKDYIFTPLSISSMAGKMAKRTRKIFGPKLGNMLPTYIALIIVWSANGVWHGAGINYFLYGFYNGILITLGMQFGDKSTAFADKVLKINRNTFSWELFQMLRTFSLVCFGRILFKADTVGGALLIYKEMFTHFNPWIFFDGTLYSYGLSIRQFHMMMVAIFVLGMVSILQEILQSQGLSLRVKISEQNVLFRCILFLTGLFVVLIFGMYGPGYSAGDFIYMKY